jgi:hypothetical protein
MPSIHQHKAFTLTPAVAQHLASLSPTLFDLELQVRAQAHHYESFPIIGVWESLTGRPQMREWDANQAAFMAEARTEFERVMGRAAA